MTEHAEPTELAAQDRYLALVPHHHEGAAAANREGRVDCHFTTRRWLDSLHRAIHLRLFSARAPIAVRIEVREIGVGPFGRVRFPEYLELAAMHGARQARRQEAMIVVGIDPDRALRRIVAVIGRGAPHGVDVGGAGAADGARQQHDADIGRLPVDAEDAVVAMPRLPARDKGAVLRRRRCFRNRPTR